MDQKLKANLTSGKHWLRFVYMVLFAIFLQVAITVMWVLVVVQFLFALITASDNFALRKVCDSLSVYIHQIIRFLTYCNDDKPFPFSDWPQSTVTEPEPVSEVVVQPEEPETVEEESTTEVETVSEAEPDSESSSSSDSTEEEQKQ